MSDYRAGLLDRCVSNGRLANHNTDQKFLFLLKIVKVFVCMSKKVAFLKARLVYPANQSNLKVFKKLCG